MPYCGNKLICISPIIRGFSAKKPPREYYTICGLINENLKNFHPKEYFKNGNDKDGS